MAHASENDGYTYHEVLPSAAAGKQVLCYLVQRYRHSDARAWRQRIAAGEVTLNGEPTEAGAELQPGQDLAWTRPPWREPDVTLEAPTLYEDDDLLAVVKPAGLPTLPGGGYLMHTLLEVVRERAPGASPMHRLGRGTSGVVLFAKHRGAARAVQAQWRLPGGVRKLYRALASGSPPGDSFDIDVPIGRATDPILAGGLHCATCTGRPAHSRVEVLERRAGATLVEVSIETGRPHQIRIHLAAAGHHLAGDPLYGAGGVRRVDSAALPGDIGYHLHAFRLALRHPSSGGELVLEAAPPRLLMSGSQC